MELCQRERTDCPCGRRTALAVRPCPDPVRREVSSGQKGLAGRQRSLSAGAPEPRPAWKRSRAERPQGRGLSDAGAPEPQAARLFRPGRPPPPLSCAEQQRDRHKIRRVRQAGGNEETQPRVQPCTWGRSGAGQSAAASPAPAPFLNSQGPTQTGRGRLCRQETRRAPPRLPPEPSGRQMLKSSLNGSRSVPRPRQALPGLPNSRPPGLAS